MSKPRTLATPNSVAVDWAVFKRGAERIRLGVVSARFWAEARELACALYQHDRGEIELLPLPKGAHLVDGEFQSDKYPSTPLGKVPLSVKDPTAQDLLWEYAQRRRSVDAEFATDLEAALRLAGFEAPTE